LSFKRLFPVCLGLLAAIAYWQWLQRPVVIPVGFTDNALPKVEVSVGEERFPVLLHVFSKYPLFLPQSLATNIPRKEMGVAEWKEAKGEVSKGPLFELKKVKLDSLPLGGVSAVSKQCEMGSVRWPFEKMNLLLDFPHGRVVGVKRDSSLKKLGYDLSKMKRVKGCFSAKGVIFQVDTPSGKLSASLHSGVNKSVMHRSLDAFEDLPISLEGQILNTIRFTKANFSRELDCELILGADFLRKHIVYLDYAKGDLYFGSRHANAFLGPKSEKIPCEFSYSGMPVMDVSINGCSYQVGLDLGSAFELSSSRSDFFLKARQIKTSTAIDAAGREELATCYELPEYRIGRSRMANVSFWNCSTDGVQLDIPIEDQGTIEDDGLPLLGFPILYRTNLFLDFNHHAFWTISDERELKKMGIDLKQFTAVPFDLQDCGMVLKAGSDIGDLRLFFDTGTTGSCLNSELLDGAARNVSLTLGEKNCDKTLFHPFDTSKKLGDFDGILGMDFIRNVPTYIDFDNQLFYIRSD
jgi:hypothetical protein